MEKVFGGTIIKTAKSIVYIILLAMIFYEMNKFLCNYYVVNNVSLSVASDEFRSFDIGEGIIEYCMEREDEYGCDYITLLSIMYIDSGYNITADYMEAFTKYMYEDRYNYLKKYKKQEFLYMEDMIRRLITTNKYYPVPYSDINSDVYVTYEDSWNESRTYGGDRVHEGTDIMADNNVRGYYPIVSVSDGTVVKMGWLTLGGYRILIESDGIYYYYAHLYSYSLGISEGDTVKAGELIGFMGDSGYSEVEGTVGNFPVHLHFGIYVYCEDGTEISINPYYILKKLEKSKLCYSY